MTTVKAETQKYRLPITVKPLHYNILIKSDLVRLQHQGITSIDLDIRNDIDVITFNISRLSITDVYITLAGDAQRQIELSKLTYDQKAEQASITLPVVLKGGARVQLTIHYHGQLTNDLRGYYYSKCEMDGSHYAITQFEPTAARRAFPCWDEPSLKATFDISMISKENTINLSNMPVLSEMRLQDSHPAASLFEKGALDGWKVTAFETTPTMSTYLIAFTNGDFKYLESSYTSPLSGKTRQLRIYTTSDLIHQAQFALDVKAQSLVEYEKAFNIEFALPKLDTSVAHDFDADAMENWGLIIGRTTVYLVDPERADLEAKQRIANTQSHEVAHMWFGNIATMKWWDNLWLNEGFATLMGEVVILNRLFPEWKVYSSFYNMHMVPALSLDARPSSHPVQVAIPNPNYIQQIFDALSYSKAPSILRMLSVYAGEEKFLKGISVYLKNRLYGNTVAEDLWAAIQQAIGLEISDLMTNWTLKIGYPVLTVTETEYGIHIRQDRFLDTGKAEEQDNQTIWHVPLSILTVNPNGEVSVDHQALLKTREETYKLDTKALWKLNFGAAGFYRVFYPPGHLYQLGQEAARPNSILTTVDRLSLLNDAMALASSGYSTTRSVLSFIDSLRSETEYLVWEGITKQVQLVIDSRIDETDKAGLREFLRTLIAPITRKLGYNYQLGEHPDTIKLRTKTIEAAANSGLTDVVQTLRNRFQIYLETGIDSHIPLDLMGITFVTAARYGGRREWEGLKKAFSKQTNLTVQNAAILGLGNIQDPILIEETLQFVLDSESVPSRFILSFFALASNPKIEKKLFNFFTRNYVELARRLDGTFQLKHLVEAAGGTLGTLQDAEELEEFSKVNNTAKISQSLFQTLDGIRARAAWLARSKYDVKSWLEGWKENNIDVKKGFIEGIE